MLWIKNEVIRISLNQQSLHNFSLKDKVDKNFFNVTLNKFKAVMLR